MRKVTKAAVRTNTYVYTALVHHQWSAPASRTIVRQSVVTIDRT